VATEPARERAAAFGFRSRIVAAFIALLTAVVLCILLIVGIAAERSVREQLSDRLQVSERVWAQLLEANAESLLESVTVLSRDFAFREAVAVDDAPTAQSALLNHGQRIDADLALLLHPDGSFRSSVEVRGATDVEAAFAPLLARAQQQGQATDVISVDGEPYLVALVPVMAPRRIAWVAMGLRYGETFAQQYRAIVGLDVAFVQRAADRTRVHASTLPGAQRQALENTRLSGQDALPDLTLAGTHYATRTFRTVDTAQGPMRIMLLADMDEAMAPTRRLVRQILLLAALAATVALLLAVVVGRGISRPVTELAQAARRIGGGDYAEPLPVRGSDELAQLATAFNAMQSGIAQREERIRHQARHDALTNLPNRSHALEQLDVSLAQARREQGSCAVLLLDLDRFKEVNDTLGHAFGDDVLQVVAQRLLHVVRRGDMLARLGGDEFLVILEGAEETVAAERARRLIESLDAPFVLATAQVSLDASVGVAVFPKHADDAAALLRRADIAMYEAKQQHSSIAVYERGHDEHHLRQITLMGELRLAQERNELSLAFQPKIDLHDGRVAHVEALLRWDHPQLGRIHPEEFIPLAEHSGLISLVTRYVIDEALRQSSPWMQQGLIQGVAINLSPLDLLDRALPGYVQERLSAHGVDAMRLVLEVTETTVMRDIVASLDTMRRLRALGVRLSIDDFGTGHSSLAHLRSLPVDEIKIDKSFILALRGDDEDAVIVRSAIEIGHNMGLSVIAEGVEDAHSLEILQALKCDMVQGYLFSPPLPAKEFVAWYDSYVHREVSA
jgi:diguanylate cyclase (GGDEF)-like protein